MTTVYLLTSGEYSSYRVDGVYSSLEKLEEAKRIHPNPEYSGWNEPEEFVIDDLLALAAQGRLLYRVYMNREGKAWSVVIYENDSMPEPAVERTGNSIISWCYATSAEHAVKIANERRAQLIASGEWDRQAKA